MTDARRVPDAWLGKEVVQLVGHSAYGGGAAVVFEILRVCAGIGLKPVLLATHPDVVAAARAEGFDIWEFPGIIREPRPFSDLVAAIRLASALRRRGTSIVHTHTSKGGMVGRLGAWLAGVPVVIHHTHGFYHSGMTRGLGRSAMETLERVFSRMDDVQIFLGEDEARISVESGIVPRRKARVVPNGIAPAGANDPADCRALRASWGVPPEAHLIGTVARLAVATKGLDTGLAVLERLLRSEPNAHWIVLGEGEDREMFVSKARELGLESRVHVPGYMAEIRRAYACLDVVFAPSRREGQSMSILEAMAAGRPVVSTDIQGNVGLLESGVTAELTAVDDVEGMANALLRLLRDPEAARALGAAAQERFERNYTQDRFDENIARIYLEVLADARPRR